MRPRTLEEVAGQAACGYRVAEFAVEFGNGGKNI